MTFSPMHIIQPFQGQAKAHRVVLLSITLVVALKLVLLVCFPYSIWNSSDDYPVHSLSHAIHLDQRLTGDTPAAVGYSQTAHPGLPFQVASWLAYRLSSVLSPGDFISRLNDVLADAGPFFTITKLLPLLVVAVTIGVVGRRFVSETSPGFLLVALLVLLSFYPSIRYGLGYLGNDTFSLSLGIALFLALRRANALDRQAFGLWWVLVGIVGGLSYLNKLNYIMWSVGIVLGYVVSSVVLRENPLIVLRNLIFFLAGFVATAVGLSELYLGHQGFLEMLRRHQSVITHDGLYGSGAAEPLNVHAVFQNMWTSFADYPYFWMLLAVIAAQACLVLWQNRTDRAWLRGNLPVLACLFAAAAMICGSAFKHYLAHYLIPLVVIGICIAWWARANVKSTWTTLAIVPFVVAAFAASLSTYFVQERRVLTDMTSLEQEIAGIKALPIEPGRHRLWTYHVSSKDYMQYFMTTLVATKEVTDLVEKQNDVERQYDIFGRFTEDEVDRMKWKYAIFQVGYFPTDDRLPDYFQKFGKVIRRTPNLVVVENTKLAPQ